MESRYGELRVGGLAGDAQLLQNLPGRRHRAGFLRDGPLHVLQRADAPRRPRLGQLVHALEHRGGLGVLAAGGLYAVLDQAKRRGGLVLQYAQPVARLAKLVVADELVPEQLAQAVVEVPIGVHLPVERQRPAVLGAHGQEGVGRGMIAHPGHQPPALPVIKGLSDLLLLHAQGQGHVRHAAAQLRVQRQHAGVQVDPERRGGGVVQVLHQKHVLDRRDVEHRRAVGKAAK